MKRPVVFLVAMAVLMAVVVGFGVSGKSMAADRIVEFNLDTGHYVSVNASDLDGSPAQRAGGLYDPAARPYADFETPDARFNAVMNRIANNPGRYACASRDERAYVRDYVGNHPSIENAVRANDMTITCPDEGLQGDLLSFNY